MPIALRCRCGQVQGEVDTDRTYARATCYCKDCQAYGRFLGTADIEDAQGGSDLVAMAPTGVRFICGQGQIACMTLSEKGLLRWYAACCRTPLANTPRGAKLPYVGVSTVGFAATQEAVDAAFGPRDRTVLNAGSANGPVRSTPLTLVTGGLRIVANIVMRRLRSERSPFFDASTGQPVRTPEVLTAAEREALDAN